MTNRKDKLPYLNVGCGKKYDTRWVNVDMVADGPDVESANLIKGIPYPANTFEVVYHSQVIEHIPQEHAAFFVGECFRVLKPGGILRVVCPDLEGITRAYLQYLEKNVSDPDPISEANYDWMLLEMYDQTVRNSSGGQMAKYIQKADLVNEDFVLGRTGFIGRQLRQRFLHPEKKSLSETMQAPGFYRKLFPFMFGKIDAFFSGKKRKIGAFRVGGEVHMWMYDRYSLARLLRSCGFENAQQLDHNTSDIKDWASYQLDVRDGDVMDPGSLFMEARKPL